jgi:uncharacterized protein YceK
MNPITKFTLAFVSITCLLASGCGTVNTTVRGDNVAARNLKDNRTYCESVPRVYSGVAYGLCSLYAEPAPVHTWHTSSEPMPTVFMDILASSILDTVVLPYTLYRQTREGNIKIK